jgi:hypothetical protein
VSSNYFPVYWAKKTNRGRVVYDRKKHPFSWKRIAAIFLSRSTARRDFEKMEGLEIRDEIGEMGAALLQISLGSKYFIQSAVRGPLFFEREAAVYPLFKEAFTNFAEMMEMFKTQKLQDLLEDLLEVFSHFVELGTPQRPEFTSGGSTIKPISGADKRVIQAGRR